MTVITEARGHSSWITLNDPDNLNTLTPELIAAVSAAVQQAEDDPNVRVLVLTGAGRAFCAGANLKRITGLIELGVDAVVGEFLQPLKLLARQLRDCPKPIIAAVNGICMAGGLETILCCDLVVAADDAVIGDQHSIFGLLPAIGGAQGLLRNVGAMRAKEMLFTGGRFTPHQLLDWGLVNKVVPRADLDDTVQALADTLGERSPAGLARMKQMVNEQGDMSWDAAARYDLSLVTSHLFGGDLNRGLQAFVQKQKPEFQPLNGYKKHL